MKVSKELILEAKKELARRDFWTYCELVAPKFFKKERAYLVEMATELQAFIASEDDVLVLNLPPRHGKSYMATLLTQWLLGKNPEYRIMTGSYNERLSTNFSKQVRNGIMEAKADKNVIVFNDIFPDVAIQHGSASMNMWSLEGSSMANYLATSPTGTATGFGSDITILDDVIKNAEEAFNSNVLEGHWDWLTNTMLSRLEENGKVILIMTRWSTQDLAGKALEELPKTGYKVKHINMKAKQDDGTMLCEEVLSLENYERKVATMSPEIAQANYNQTPVDIQGRLYQGFNTYNTLPEFKRIEAYVDTADTGKDFLASYIYGITSDDNVYILDAIYTKDSMETTEPLLAQALHQHQVNVAHIESNNGGRGFSRNVQRILKDKFGSNKTVIKAFHQSKNKEARIYSSSAWVQQHVVFPDGWQNTWRELHDDLMSYQKSGKNANDDAQDALAGIFDKTAGQRNTWLV